MSHPRVPQEISQPITENLQKLAALFPSAIKDGELDIEALREELGEFEEIRPGDEKYELNWVGKQAAKKEAFAPLLGKTLAFKPEESKDPDTTENLYIEGDNLEALKLLRQNYYGEVKMIYIDPPYNTGGDFVYTDKFKVSEEQSEEEEGSLSPEGKRLVKNDKSSNRFHARWLDMMYPRLRLAKDLLREDGIVFISIDDNEITNLKKLCDEIFGRDNFVESFVWKKSYGGGPKERYAVTQHENILCYARSLEKLPHFFLKYDPSKIKRYYKNTDKNVEVRGPFRLKPLEATKSMDPRPNLVFGIPSPSGSEIFPKRQWLWSKERVLREIEYGGIEFISSSQGETVNYKQYLRDENGVERGEKPFSVIDGIYTQKGTEDVRGLFDDKVVIQFPKPVLLISKFLEIGLPNSEPAIVLDFFSGSATTAHAVMQLNAEDGGKRRHIMVQLPEVCDEKSVAAKAGYKTIAEIGRERIRRAGEKVKEELQAKHEEWKKNKALAEKKGELELKEGKEEAPEESNPYVLNPDSLDIGFKAFRIEDTKINWIRKDLKGEEISFQGMGNQDALDFVPGFTDEDIVYEVMLRQSNIPLTQTITKPVSGKNGKRTYLYGESYLISLEETVTKELIETLAALEPTPLKYFFRDSAFGKDIALKDETFRRLNAEIAKNHGDQGTAYTVEFI